MLGLLLLMLGTTAVQMAPPPKEAPQAESGQKPMLTTRLETEYKLAVPAGDDEAVWRWLSTHYAKAKPAALGAGWTSNMGEETFRDRYFDVPAGTLLAVRAGLRHRQRFTPKGELTKQMVQLKITDDAGGLLREELKFKPIEGGTAEMTLAELVRPTDRARLDTALAQLGVKLVDTQLAFVLSQRRRRLYLLHDGEAFSTITLDSSYHADGAPATFTEIEVELNEKRYTGASEKERAQMRVVLDSIRADLFRQFPHLEQDQRPKYEKLAALLPVTATPNAQPVTLETSQTPPSAGRTWLYAILGAVGGLGLGFWVMRSRRKQG